AVGSARVTTGIACAITETVCAGAESRANASAATVTRIHMRITKASPEQSELRATVALAVPVVFVQLGFMTMGAVDTLMVGRLSATMLAAVALGNLYFFNVSIFGAGALMALDPLVAQAVGARDMNAVTHAMQRGIVLSIALAVVTSIVLAPAEILLRFLH